MKLPKMFRREHTIAGRLTWRVVGWMTVIMTVILALIFGVMWVIGVVGLSGYYKLYMEVYDEKINNVFSAVEVAISNNRPEVEENIDREGREFYAVEHLLALNPNIMGAAVAYNPDCEPRKGEPFSPYAYHDSTGIHTKQLNTKEYDYLHQEWYTKPISEGKGVWSDPYLDEGGGEVMMITYSQPLINSQGEIYAIQTADIALDWLSDLITQLDSTFTEEFFTTDDLDSDSIHNFIITRNGTFLTRPGKEQLTSRNIVDYLKNQGCKNAEKKAEQLLDGQTDIVGYKNGKGERMLIFPAEIEHSGWYICSVLPMSEIIYPVSLFISFLFALMIIGLVIVGLTCRKAIRRVTKPITEFANSADEISKGNLTAELPTVKTEDEMLRLHESFKMMQTSLVHQIEETKAANEEKGRIESELYIARNIQMSMLPKIFPPYPDRNDIEIFGQLTPAKEVGGDLYDFYIRDEKLFFCIGDVSGKGVPASLVMAVIRTLFRTISYREAQPDRIMYGMNNAMADNNESDMFVTLFLGVLDLPTGRLRYCNAGHNSPLLKGEQRIGLLPCHPNIPLGVTTEWKFDHQETTIDLGTTIFLYTDGLTEAENTVHEQFEEKRMIDVAKEAPHEPKELIEQMISAVRQFVGNAVQSDDLTMLAIQYTKPLEKDMKLQRSITLPNDIEEVPQLAAFVDEVCEIAGFDMSTTMSINLALEEAVVNVMSYAYPAGTVGNVNIEAVANDNRLKFIISDWGTPFDPTAEKEVDTTLSAEERPIGGLGIHLVRQIMDSINYERIDGKNVLTLRKKLV